MKKFQLTIIALVLLPLFSQSQDFWEELYFPDTARLRCIGINNKGYIFAGVGDNQTFGGVYRSIDSAESWELVLHNGNFSVNKIAFNNHGDIYIGKGGADNFMVTYDDGENWEIINLPSYSYGNVTKILPIGIDTLFVSSGSTSGTLLIRSYDSGITWDSVFTTYNHTSEFISDIIKTDNGELYISLSAYLPDMGGVYISEDGGTTWSFSGLFNHAVSSLAVNTANDVFAGVWGSLGDEASPGLYVLREGATDWDTLLFGGQVEDIVVNTENNIYFTSTWPDGVIRSLDNGETFEMINEGLPNAAMGYLTIDIFGFLYVTSHYPSSFLARSINTTVSINEKRIETLDCNIQFYPNPVENKLTIKSSSINNESLNITIYNMLGDKLVSDNVASTFGYIQMDVGQLIPGMYLLEISYKNQKTVNKLIKK